MTDLLERDADDAWENAGRSAGRRLVDRSGRPAPMQGDPSRFATVAGIPEVECVDLGAQVLADAIAAKGSLVVRSFLSSEAVETVRADYRGKQHQIALSADVVRDDGANAAATMEASWVSAAALKHIVDYCRSADYFECLRELFGEQPALQRERASVAERSSRIPGLPWHQDAAYYGLDVIGLNAWISLTAASADWPCLEVCPRRFDGVVGLSDPERDFRNSPAPHNYSLEEAADEIERVLAETPPVSPSLGPGDALLFDTRNLHRTPVARAEVARENVTLWAFAPSVFPAWGTPFAVDALDA